MLGLKERESNTKTNAKDLLEYSQAKQKFTEVMSCLHSLHEINTCINNPEPIDKDSLVRIASGMPDGGNITIYFYKNADKNAYEMCYIEIDAQTPDT